MASDKTELRGLVPAELAAALDAIALSRNTDRNSLVVFFLTRDVNQIAHRSNVLQRMSRGNALLSDASAPTQDLDL